MRSRIDWRRIGDAVRYYERAGFKYVEVPWIVEYRSVAATIPPGRAAFELSNAGDKPPDTLVGSAEQSFLQMMLDGDLGFDARLGTSSYVAVSPCFRDDEVDELHHKDFVKVELILVEREPLSREHARLIALEAKGFYQQAGANPRHVHLVETEIGIDIEYGGIEIGSYGARSHEGHHWVYGTGLAEPRFSQALARRA